MPTIENNKYFQIPNDFCDQMTGIEKILAKIIRIAAPVSTESLKKISRQQFIVKLSFRKESSMGNSFARKWSRNLSLLKNYQPVSIVCINK